MYSYNGEHSVKFVNSSNVERNTWTNWHLIPTEKPVIPMPDYDKNIVEIPGMNGSLDLSTYLTGSPVYRDRQGSITFKYVGENFDSDMNTIAQFIHGRKLKLYLTDDPDYYYEGSMSLSSKKADAGYPIVTISYRVGPYKTHRTSGAQQF